MSEATALGRQVGGSHYVGMGIQPVEFWAANGWDSFAGAILKYLSRWKDKNGVADLRKALHFAQLRVELDGAVPPPPVDVDRRITMNAYVKANNIPAEEDVLFYALDGWVALGRKFEARKASRTFIELLRDFIEDQELKSTNCGDSK